MKLTQAELIQVLRRRANLNQGDFGARAFDTSYESGRTKVKNIELGKQHPTPEDIKKMARVLKVDERDIQHPDRYEKNTRNIPLKPEDATVSAQVLDTFPGLEGYLDMLNKAVRIGDAELIGHISCKAAAIFRNFKIETSLEVAATQTKGQRITP